MVALPVLLSFACMMCLAVCVVLVLVRRNSRSNPSGGTGECLSGGFKPRSAQEEKLRVYCQDKCASFVNHLKSKHASDPRAQATIRTWNGTVTLFDAAGARFIRGGLRSGCLYVNPGNDASYPRLHTKLLHELAHATPSGHDPRWQDAFVFFLGIATAELGWKCEMRCGACQSYGVCSKTKCPKCTWLEDPALCPKPHYTLKDCATNCE